MPRLALPEESAPVPTSTKSEKACFNETISTMLQPEREMPSETESYINEIWNIHRELGIRNDRSQWLGPMFRENLNSVQTGVDKPVRHELPILEMKTNFFLRLDYSYLMRSQNPRERDLGIPPGFDLLSEDLQEYQDESSSVKSGRLEKFSQTATQVKAFAAGADGTNEVPAPRQAPNPDANIPVAYL